MSPLARASCRCLGPCERSSVTHDPSNLTIVAEYFFIRLPWVVGHVVALEPSHVGRRGPEPRAHGGSGALPRREAGSEAVGCMATPEPSRTGRLGPVPWDTRQCIVARPASCVSSELICEISGL
jgi:hypothetical protein